MTVNDYVFVAVDVALWIAIIWHGAHARAVGELWWSCVCIAGIVSLKIGVIAGPLNRITGGIYLDELLGHLLGVTAAALTVSWLVLILEGSRERYRRLLVSVAAAVIVALLATWFFGPIYDIPADSDWIPNAVRQAPALVAHWLILQLALICFSVAFAVIVSYEATKLAPGFVRVSVILLGLAGSVLVLTMGIGVVDQILLILRAEGNDLIPRVQNALLFIVFFLFLLAVAIPLTRYRRRNASSDSTSARVETLWTWIRDAAGRDDSEAASIDFGEPRDRLYDQIIDIRDHIRYLQGYVGPVDLALAGQYARGRGLIFGTRARANVTAACLVLGAQRHSEDAQPVSPPPANLARLGGGRTLAQEAHWLAAVSDALFERLGSRSVPSTQN